MKKLKSDKWIVETYNEIEILYLIKNILNEHIINHGLSSLPGVEKDRELKLNSETNAVFREWQEDDLENWKSGKRKLLDYKNKNLLKKEIKKVIRNRIKNRDKDTNGLKHRVIELERKIVFNKEITKRGAKGDTIAEIIIELAEKYKLKSGEANFNRSHVIVKIKKDLEQKSIQTSTNYISKVLSIHGYYGSRKLK